MMCRSSDRKTLIAVFSVSRKVNGNIEKLEDYKAIVSGDAYQDFTPRNLKGVKKTREDIKAVLDELAYRVFNYIHDERKLFDEWHKETCDWFVEEFNNAAKTDIRAGKAQKIVNMTLKYVYCFEGADDYLDKFEYCHMALDQYTLEWFCNTILPKYNEGKDRKNRVLKTAITDKRWSNLEYGDSTIPGTYAWIQNQIREYLKPADRNKEYRDGNKALTPFEAEFYIWPEQQFKEVYKSIKSNPVFNEAYPSYSDSDLNKKSIEISEKIKHIEGKFE